MNIKQQKELIKKNWNSANGELLSKALKTYFKNVFKEKRKEEVRRARGIFED